MKFIFYIGHQRYQKISASHNSIKIQECFKYDLINQYMMRNIDYFCF